MADDKSRYDPGVYDPPRQLGRISDEDWELLQAAAKVSGAKNFTKWALAVLLAEAKQLLKPVEE
mgnify:CR=1 FL=1